MPRDAVVAGPSALGGPVLTILISDVVRSTELYDSAGDVATHAAIAVHDEIARAAVEAHGGRLVKRLGDGVLAVFTSPRSALSTAAALQSGLAARRAADSTFDLDVRVGLNTGEVIEEHDGDVHGLAVAIAARVAAEATAGRVLATDLVARLAGRVPGLGLLTLGTVPLKGVAEPVLLHEVRWELAATGTPAHAPAAATTARPVPDRAQLVGRVHEVADLERWMADAASGSGRLVLVQGEPGIGKTRLAEEIAARAQRTGAAVAWGRCVADEGAPALWPWRQILGSLGVEIDVIVDAGASDADKRFLAFEHLSERVREVARARPVLLVFDDLHWADHASLLLLAHLTRTVPAPPALVVATFRATEPGTLPPVLADLSRTRGAERIELAGLSEDAVREYVSAVSGVSITRSVALDVRAATGGNPLFVGEIGRALRDGVWTGTIPATVRDVTRQRVARLSGGCGELLRVASVLGRDFSTTLAAAVAGVDVETAMTLLDEATAAGLVEPALLNGEHRFTHALVRDAIESDLPSATKIALHVSSARAIEAIHAGRLEPHLPDLARHWAAAVPAGHAAEALEWAERAADAALRDLAYEEAARLYRSALAHAAASTDRACRLQLSLARALYLTGDLRGCADASFAAAELARDIGRADFLGEAALVLEAVALPELNARVYDLCVEAIDRLGDDASQDALRARLLAQLSHLSFYSREYDRLDTLSRDALDLARRTGDDTALVTALRARQEAVSGPHGISEVGELAHSMLAAGRRMRSPSVSMWGHVWYLDALWAQGRLADARVELDRLAECVARIGGPIPRWHLARCRAVVAQAQGRLAEAHAFALESYEVMKGVEPETARRGYVVALTMLGHHARLRDDEVELFLPDEPPAFVLANAMRAVGLIDAGRVEEARAKFARLGPASGWQVPPFLRVSMLVGALLAKVRLGPRDDVAHIHGVLSEYRGFNAVGGAGAYVYMGPVELYLGAAAAYLGRPDEAIADLETAIDRSTCSGTIGFTLEAMIELARVLVDRDRPRATELAGRAADDADALGMDVLAGRARDVLGKATRTASVLSAREDEVAALVAQGKTNREIAEALFISERTAQNHVQHILTKLGFSRRSEIATWVARRPE